MSEDFVKFAESKDIRPSSMKAVDVGGEKVCVINIEGNYYAIGNVCTHMGGPFIRPIAIPAASPDVKGIPKFPAIIEICAESVNEVAMAVTVD